MINFLRRVRQKKMGKYVPYALGEIFLVVVGILIALEVSNWNENRKEIERQKKLYANLKIDFQSRLTELESFYDAKNTAIANIHRLNVIIASREAGFEEDEVAELLASLLNNFVFNDAFELLEGVFNSGMINDIRDENLKRALIQWPQLVEEMLEEQRIFEFDNLNKFGPLIDKYISMRTVYEKFAFRAYALPQGTPKTLEEDYEGILSDPSLENFLASKELLLRISIIDNQNLINAANEIIGLLNKQIE